MGERIGIARSDGLDGKVVVVTGASSGVRRAIARAAGERGARVALFARGVDGLHAAAEEIERAGGESLALPVDVVDASSVDAAADVIAATWGRIDVWVNNAMVSVLAPVEDTTAAEFRRVTDVNYLGTVHGTLAALRHTRERRMHRGAIAIRALVLLAMATRRILL